MPSFDLPTPVVPQMTIRGFEDMFAIEVNGLLKTLIWRILRKADERVGIEGDRPSTATFAAKTETRWRRS